MIMNRNIDFMDVITQTPNDTVVVPGDVLGNGVMNIGQVVAVAQDLAGTRKLEGPYALAGDLNGSGSIDVADVVKMAQMYAQSA